MIPTHAVMSCDSGPAFRPFWPHVARLWRKMGVEPVLVTVGFEPTTQECEEGTTMYVAYVPDIDLAFQASTARYFIFGQLGDSCAILTDIDMLPLSRKYFLEQLAALPEDDFAHLNSKPPEGYSRIPSCYHVAKGSVFNRLMKVGSDWPEFLRRVLKLGVTRRYILWGTEEHYATHCLEANRATLIRHNGCIEPLYAGHVNTHMLRREAGRRIDRPAWIWTEETFGHYYDAHCVRPLAENWEKLEPVIRLAGFALDKQLKN